PVESGKFKGEIIEKEKFERMKDEYYMLRGWDVKKGIPTRKKLEELGLHEVANDLNL
ncbi:unnamed protein product, partial [marine sediment metagenome]